MTRKTKINYLLLLFVITITPLGLLTDYVAWGEWENSYFEKTLGFIPVGIEKTSNLLSPLFSNYQVIGNSKIINQYFSAIIGVAIIFMIFYLSKFLLKTSKSAGNRD